MMRGGGKGGSEENVLDDGIWHRVRFEAANRAARAQKSMKIHHVGLGVDVNFFWQDLEDDARLTGSRFPRDVVVLQG